MRALLLLSGLAAAAVLAIGFRQLVQEERRQATAIEHDRFFLAIRSANALGDELRRCRRLAETRPPAAALQECQAPFPWFTGHRRGEPSDGLPPREAQAERARWTERSAACQREPGLCLDLATRLSRLPADRDPTVARFGLAVAAALDRHAPDSPGLAALRARLDQLLFTDALRRHGARLAGGWLGVGRYRIRPGAGSDPDQLIGFDAQPAPDALRRFLIGRNIVEGGAFRFQILAPGAARAAPPEGVSLGYIDDQVGLLSVRDPLLAERRDQAQGATRTAQLWLLVAAGLLFLSLWAIDRSVRGAARNLRVQENFVSSVSHEFRTPLGGLSLMLDTLLADRIEDPQRRRAYLEQMRRETDRLGRLAENVLALGRMQRGSVAVDGRWDPVGLLDRVVARLAPEAGERDVQLAVAVRGEPPQGLGDGDLIEMAVGNLVHNAIKFSPSGAQVEIGLEGSQTDLTISVADRGPGVPRRDRERIFAWFERARAPKNGRAGGTGLGLAIVREVARRHRGRVGVEDRPGGGSLFRLTLPGPREGRS